MVARLVRLVRLASLAQIRALLVAGLLIVTLVAAAAVAAAPASANPTPDTYFFISSIGATYATGHAFSGSSPDAIATDADGNVYVTLPAGIAKFNSAGTWICDYAGDNGYTPGAGYGIDVENIHGTIFLAESTSHRIVMLRPDDYGLSGNVYTWKSLTGHNSGDGTSGAGNGEFNFPADVAVDGNHLYVADKLNHRIQKFSVDYDANTLTWVASWGKNGGDGTPGSDDGEFSRPTGVAADGHGHIFVADSLNHRIQELTTSGVFVTKWGVSAPSSDPLYLSDLNGIDVDAQGNVYATDFSVPTSWVNKYSLGAGGVYEFVTRIGSWGTGDAQFQFPWNIAVDPTGYLYVTDTQNLKLKKFARDATPPTVAPSGFVAGWTNDPRHPELHATDPVVTGQYTSGGVTIYYSLNGAAWHPFEEPFSSWVEGDNTVTYYGTDAVGNTSTQAAVHVYYDGTEPVTAVSGVPGGWSKTDVVVTLTPGVDSFSPIAATQYRLQGVPTWTTYTSAFTVSAEGTSIYEYRSSDTADNYETPKSLTVSIDKTAPVTGVSGVPDGWSKTPVTATLTPSNDGLSPIASTEYRFQGAAMWTPYASPFPVTAEGSSVYEYRSTDTAGNVEAAKTVTVGIDATAPVTIVSGIPAGWSKRTVHFTLDPSDPCSGVKSTSWSTDGATWTSGLTGAISAEGTTTLRYSSIDNLDSAETVQTATIRIDTAIPVPMALHMKSVVRNRTVKLPFRVNDATGPQAKVTIRIYKGSALKKTLVVGTKATNTALSYSYKCKLARGKYSWKVYATDLAGNAQAKPGVKTLKVK